MKPFMLRHKNDWLPNKLQYGATYWIGFIAVAHEGFTFKLSKNSNQVSLKDDSGERFISKRELKDYFKGEYLQFATEIEPEE